MARQDIFIQVAPGWGDHGSDRKCIAQAVPAKAAEQQTATMEAAGDIVERFTHSRSGIGTLVYETRFETHFSHSTENGWTLLAQGVPQCANAPTPERAVATLRLRKLDLWTVGLWDGDRGRYVPRSLWPSELTSLLMDA